MKPSAEKLYAACDHTWPPAAWHDYGPWMLREGRGGGKRVSAATACAPPQELDIAAAAQAMRRLKQRPLFSIRQDDERLDAQLAAAGYEIVDPVVMYTLPIDRLTDRHIPPVTAFEIWEPLAIMEEIWQQGGIGAARIEVMRRVQVKTAIFARWRDRPAGVAFAGVHHDICMVHAVEVLPHQRRQGVAVWMMRRAAFWGAARGARYICVLCVVKNQAANALYRALGFEEAGRYHYRALLEQGK